MELIWYKIFNSLEEAENRFGVFDVFAVKAGGKKICIARTTDGFFAVDDACPHLGQSLAEGKCNYKGEIVCPWHSYRFDMESGEEVSGNGCRSVNTYPIKVDSEGLYVGV